MQLIIRLSEHFRLSKDLSRVVVIEDSLYKEHRNRIKHVHEDLVRYSGDFDT